MDFYFAFWENVSVRTEMTDALVKIGGFYRHPQLQNKPPNQPRAKGNTPKLTAHYKPSLQPKKYPSLFKYVLIVILEIETCQAQNRSSL